MAEGFRAFRLFRREAAWENVRFPIKCDDMSFYKKIFEKIIEKLLTNPKNLAIILNCIIIACSMGFYCECDKIHSYFWRNLCKKDNKKRRGSPKGQPTTLNGVKITWSI